MSAPQRYPLTWPDGVPRRTGGRDTGAFKTGLPQALKNVEASLRLFGQDSNRPVSGVVISSNVTLGHEKPADPGVAIWFTWEGQQICIPVDRYATVQANLQAIHYVLEARRTEARHGTLALVRATMKGFVSLPAPKSWREVLEIPPNVSVSAGQLSVFYRAAAKKAAGESELIDINLARDRAHLELGL